ncbi:hypothetical protein [Kordiimonas sp. SCSIO 12610]|uniref:hypothetical protein n=1 Tax=Kordiimonas sp. SCSIO 12610 TaxID=2829597 RepID=UPI00210EBF18|nr:hypothetical protein [Kordiimonas sp. SCSIO 12610]UTW55994.1 hypothetical protein KFF44_03625 [Kordiimonas sp. SCSIO 12610]
MRNTMLSFQSIALGAALLFGTTTDANAQNAPEREPTAIQEIIEDARTRCRGMRGAFSMKTSAVRNDIDLNGDGIKDYLIDGNAFDCDRGNARSYRTNSRLRNQRITLIMSETSDYTIHEFPTTAYQIVDFDDENILLIREAEENCNSRKPVRPVSTYRQGQLIGPGCYRALVWRDGIFSAAR